MRRSRMHREEVQRSKPEAMPPDESRNEGTPSPSEGPNAGAQTFGSFGAFAKGTRRKGETASRSTRRNGYERNKTGTWSAQRPPSPNQSRKCPTIPLSSLPNCASSTLEAAFPRMAIED